MSIKTRSQRDRFMEFNSIRQTVPETHKTKTTYTRTHGHIIGKNLFNYSLQTYHIQIFAEMWNSFKDNKLY